MIALVENEETFSHIYIYRYYILNNIIYIYIYVMMMDDDGNDDVHYADICALAAYFKEVRACGVGMNAPR